MQRVRALITVIQKGVAGGAATSCIRQHDAVLGTVSGYNGH
ncbi:MAG: hypothetical protein ACOYBM_01720 [Dethiobacteria bacterium]